MSAGNFMRMAPVTAALSLVMLQNASVDTTGFWYAVASGALTSAVLGGIGLVILERGRRTAGATG